LTTLSSKHRKNMRNCCKQVNEFQNHENSPSNNTPQRIHMQ
jgi:hypothetical protein